MKIKEITSEHRNDFYWIPECEHCGAVARERSGYHDNNYHVRVIPGMRCGECGKNRAGEAIAAMGTAGRAVAA